MKEVNAAEKLFFFLYLQKLHNNSALVSYLLFEFLPEFYHQQYCEHCAESSENIIGNL